MDQLLGYITYVVRDYEEAISFFCETLDFKLVADTKLTSKKRWVLVSPPGSETSLLLAKASTPEQAAVVGNQAGGRVFLFLHTDDFWRDYNRMLTKGIEFMEEPRKETYGTVVVFKDLYGNKWDLLEMNNNG